MIELTIILFATVVTIFFGERDYFVYKVRTRMLNECPALYAKLPSYSQMLYCYFYVFSYEKFLEIANRS